MTGIVTTARVEARTFSEEFEMAHASGTPRSTHNDVATSDVRIDIHNAVNAVSFDHNSLSRDHGTRTKSPTSGTAMTAIARTASAEILRPVFCISRTAFRNQSRQQVDRGT